MTSTRSTAKGYYLTEKGHKRLTTGPNRGKHEHRVKIAKLLQEHPHPIWGDQLPAEIDIHHVDGNPGHNCLSNLILLQHEIHSAVTMTTRHRCPWTGRLLSREEYLRSQPDYWRQAA